MQKSAAIRGPLVGMSGAVLAEGAVCLLSGAGGATKSTLALDVAYGGELADPDRADGMGRGFSGLFEVRPGPVMMASYEDPAGSREPPSA